MARAARSGAAVRARGGGGTLSAAPGSVRSVRSAPGSAARRPPPSAAPTCVPRATPRPRAASPGAAGTGAPPGGAQRRGGAGARRGAALPARPAPSGSARRTACSRQPRGRSLMHRAHTSPRAAANRRLRRRRPPWPPRAAPPPDGASAPLYRAARARGAAGRRLRPVKVRPARSPGTRCSGRCGTGGCRGARHGVDRGVRNPRVSARCRPGLRRGGPGPARRRGCPRGDAWPRGVPSGSR